MPTGTYMALSYMTFCNGWQWETNTFEQREGNHYLVEIHWWNPHHLTSQPEIPDHFPRQNQQFSPIYKTQCQWSSTCVCLSHFSIPNYLCLATKVSMNAEKYLVTNLQVKLKDTHKYLSKYTAVHVQLLPSKPLQTYMSIPYSQALRTCRFSSRVQDYL